ncbi:Cu Zn superoxide dismutase-like protein [Dacryopinax primogenitus]|uniref:Superoxide dismutase 1 copper chaperone n=1 Tax=Dacryopinax primogenitus (strain DJM 731) TaxID=1858805 RepID=M5G2Y1_DACPD|nr:Cu Zn superoxide dismutase-like protein [Dacryopinax primogenitus]EJU02585.1 Cu Zn superoxide dismutase-like protein [Dacryopinax primogenitus]
MSSTSFKTEFAVYMTCEHCVSDVQSALAKLPNLDRYDIDLPSQSVTVTGRTAPSLLAKALRDTGRQVIIRGTTGRGGAAVAILEEPYSSTVLDWHSKEHTQKVHGIGRLVQLTPTQTLLDLTVRSTLLKPEKVYEAYVARTGDLSKGPDGAGGVLHHLGEVRVDDKGYGDLFVEKEGLSIWDLIGRAMVFGEKGGKGMWAGVVARSAGVWGNAKTVCSCSGRDLWEEGREMDKRME